MNAASKCLARMKGCWDPEFEPSVEEIVVSNPDPSLSRSAGCIASPARVIHSAGDAIHPALREREGSGFETKTIDDIWRFSQFAFLHSREFPYSVQEEVTSGSTG